MQLTLEVVRPQRRDQRRRNNPRRDARAPTAIPRSQVPATAPPASPGVTNAADARRKPHGGPEDQRSYAHLQRRRRQGAVDLPGLEQVWVVAHLTRAYTIPSSYRHHHHHCRPGESRGRQNQKEVLGIRLTGGSVMGRAGSPFAWVRPSLAGVPADRTRLASGGISRHLGLHSAAASRPSQRRTRGERVSRRSSHDPWLTIRSPSERGCPRENDKNKEKKQRNKGAKKGKSKEKKKQAKKRTKKQGNEEKKNK